MPIPPPPRLTTNTPTINLTQDLRSLSIWEILGKAIDECALRGLVVMLDMHTLGPQETTDLWVRGFGALVVVYTYVYAELLTRLTNPPFQNHNSTTRSTPRRTSCRRGVTSWRPTPTSGTSSRWTSRTSLTASPPGCVPQSLRINHSSTHLPPHGSTNPRHPPSPIPPPPNRASRTRRRTSTSSTSGPSSTSTTSSRSGRACTSWRECSSTRRRTSPRTTPSGGAATSAAPSTTPSTCPTATS